MENCPSPFSYIYLDDFYSGKFSDTDKNAEKLNINKPKFEEVKKREEERVNKNWALCEKNKWDKVMYCQYTYFGIEKNPKYDSEEAMAYILRFAKRLAARRKKGSRGTDITKYISDRMPFFFRPSDVEAVLPQIKDAAILPEEEFEYLKKSIPFKKAYFINLQNYWDQ
ncbi:MAG: hypothetical protein J6T16_08175 [Opitutales bacterium]|nr:hypothetical protein [Opitutales bacterium]